MQLLQIFIDTEMMRPFRMINMRPLCREAPMQRPG